MSFPIALITGTGMDELFSPKTEEKTGLPVFKTELKHVARTTHGGPVRAQIVRGDGLEFLWLDRHNSSKRYCCPHEINSAAYMKMLYDNGVQFIFATSAVGGINRAGFDRLEVGSLVIPEDFIDLTKGSYTFNNPAHTHPLAFYRPRQVSFALKWQSYFQKLISKRVEFTPVCRDPATKHGRKLQ